VGQPGPAKPAAASAVLSCTDVAARLAWATRVSLAEENVKGETIQLHYQRSIARHCPIRFTFAQRVSLQREPVSCHRAWRRRMSCGGKERKTDLRPSPGLCEGGTHQ
jgi:hypothetical protein